MPISREKAYWNLKQISERAGRSFLTAITEAPNAPLNIHIIRVTESGRGIDTQGFPARIRDALETYGIFINQGQLPMVQDVAKNFNRISQTRRLNFKGAFDAAYTQLGSPYLVVVLLPNTDTTTYSDVKWWADCDRGVATVCIGPKGLGTVSGSKGDQTLGNLR